MKSAVKSLILLFVCILFSSSLAAFQPFVIKNIRIQGLNRIKQATVDNYLSVSKGEELTEQRSNNLLKTLYETDFFSDISLDRQGDTLIIKVVERPTIGSIQITGNKAISTKKLKTALKNMGLAPGEVFDRAMLKTARVSLINEYYNQGKYNARVTLTVEKIDRNRVNINIVISEGRIAEIKGITILGNAHYSEKELLKTFKLTTPTWLSWFTKSDQYAREKMEASLEALRSFYMDRGYIKFKIDSSQVSITPDHKYIYITVRIIEGARYFVKGFRVEGHLLYPSDVLEKQVGLTTGEYFSREKVIQAEQRLATYYGDRGYGFPAISVKPIIDDKTKQVELVFSVSPGQRIYVRRINFQGNVKTEDVVLRRAMRQEEGGLISVKNIKESTRQLNLLGYLKDVQMNMKRLPGSPNLVDVDYKVTEQPSSQAMFGVGFSSTDGLLINASVQQNNFLGTGKMLGVSFENSFFQRLYQIQYNNPYYTPSGVQRGFDVFMRKTFPKRVNISTYSTDEYGGNLNYLFPVTENNSVGMSVGLRRINIVKGSSPATQIIDFTNAEGHDFRQLLLSPSWSYNGLDRAIFPTKGTKQSLVATLSAPVGSSDQIKYYRADYELHWYQPLHKDDWILKLRSELGYGGGYSGTKALPFFANFFAGGIDSVRGYNSNSLGPRDSQDNAIGGNLLTVASAALIFPNPFSKESLRTSIFLDSGNVFETKSAYGINASGFKVGDLRYSAGLGVIWRTPLAPLMFSVAKPINPRSGDDTEVFQFTIAFGI